MANLIAVIVIVAILALAAGYVVRAKKRGAKCIGCPDSKTCATGQGSKCSGNCGSCNGHCGH